jgi:uncharacterized C2H2 Zn-finger protein
MTKLKKFRHYFFLSSYEGMAFTRCPGCETKTLVRKFCLAIHIEPKNLFFLNKICKYCPRCDLVITQKADLEHCRTLSGEQHFPDVVGNKYLVMGTMERSDWKLCQAGKLLSTEVFERLWAWKDVKDFEIRCGWYRDNEK